MTDNCYRDIKQTKDLSGALNLPSAQYFPLDIADHKRRRFAKERNLSNGIFVTIIFSLKPGAAEQLISVMPGMFAETRTKQGFRSIKAIRSHEDPNRIFVLQEWNSVEEYQTYFAWRNARNEGFADMEAMLAAPPVFDIWDQQVA